MTATRCTCACSRYCWAHILRDAEDVCISHRDIPYYRELYRSLRMIFHRAKEVAARTAAAGGADMTTCRQFADEVRGPAARYGNLKFAGTLHSAADNLFTFLRYPGMPPTNNGSERDIRDWVVPIREVSHKFMTERGMRVFSILQSFAATCSKMNLNMGKSFLKVLHDPTHNIVREGLSAVSDTPLMLPAPLPAALPALPPPRPALPAAPPMLPAPLPAAGMPAKPSYAAHTTTTVPWGRRSRAARLACVVDHVVIVHARRIRTCTAAILLGICHRSTGIADTWKFDYVAGSRPPKQVGGLSVYQEESLLV